MRRSGVHVAALAVLALGAPASGPAPAAAASTRGLIVIPKPVSGPALSYFKLSVRPGAVAVAGTVGVRNDARKRLRVALEPVEGETINTLGSTYAPPGSKLREAARWLRIGSRRLSLAPGASVLVPVSMVAPKRARPGDYLAGVSVEALDQRASRSPQPGVSIASVVRYVIGAEMSIPGPRVPAIKFSGAQVERQPAGVVFLLRARNTGNVILQQVKGRALITQGRRAVARVPLGPGTFVTRSSIAYPVPTPRERPRRGAVYRVRAYLRYQGGIARLDTSVSFGRRQAAIQSQYGGPKVGGGGAAWWKIALLAAAVLYGLTVTVLLLRRRHRPAQTP
jgi:hypothetical protein